MTTRAKKEPARRRGTPEATRTLAILGYHKIGPPPGDWDTWFYVPLGTFVAHLAYLRENGWRVIGVAELLAGLADPRRLPERAALITFDDGCRSFLEYGLPELERFGYPAVMFVPSDFVGGSNTFDEGSQPDEPICGWGDLRQLHRRGVSVQSHGASHRAFAGLSAAEIKEEVCRSRAVLEAGLGRRVEVFSFPFGDGGRGARTRRVLRDAGYRAACLYGGGRVCLPGADPYRLQRVAVGPDTDMAAELTGGGTDYGEG